MELLEILLSTTFEILPHTDGKGQIFVTALFDAVCDHIRILALIF